MTVYLISLFLVAYLYLLFVSIVLYLELKLELAVNHIVKSFGEKEVLKDVSFLLKKEHIYVLMGVNGSGKTTLFHILTGFLKADAGAIILNNILLKNESSYLINRKGISRTFQDMRLIKELTVLENVLLSFPNQEGEKWWKVLVPNKKVSQEQYENKIKAEEILRECFIDNVSSSKAGEISYGQQKLLNLACCIANDAKVFLLDEPVAGVNPVYRDKLVEVIKSIKNKGKIILIIEHNTDFIEAIADEILFLNEGVITNYASYNALRNDTFVQEAYIL